MLLVFRLVIENKYADLNPKQVQKQVGRAGLIPEKGPIQKRRQDSEPEEHGRRETSFGVQRHPAA